MKQIKESLVFIDDIPCTLRYKSILPDSARLYYQYKCEPVELAEGVDFSIDCSTGTIRALSDKITNYNKSAFYNVQAFDHTQFKAYGNYDYTYSIDYSFNESLETTNQQVATELAKSSAKITSVPAHTRLLVFGDSISTGAEASSLEKTYFGIFAQALRERFSASVELINGSVGGDTSSDGMKHFDKDALSYKPDICIIGFGMNDQNRAGEGGHFVETAEYENNIRRMITSLKAAGSAVILVSPCRPNPRWKWTSGDTGLYTEVLRRLAKEYTLPFADVTALWDYNLKCGKTYESLLNNDINHPNDFGHSIYADVLNALIQK